jgi:hypothetical protein
MKTDQHLNSPTQEEQIRKARDSHWHASAIGDLTAEYDIYDTCS